MVVLERSFSGCNVLLLLLNFLWILPPSIVSSKHTITTTGTSSSSLAFVRTKETTWTLNSHSTTATATTAKNTFPPTAFTIPRGGSSCSLNKDNDDDSRSTEIDDCINQSFLPSSLNLTIHEDLLTSAECKAILDAARPFLRPSKVGRPARVEPSLRLSLSCKLPRLPIPELWAVESKLAQAAGVPIEHGEDLQVGGYPIGHYYGMHCDERKGGRPPNGGRLATALAYLNDLDPGKATGGYTVFSGKPFPLLPGEPDFPESDIRVRELNRLSNPAADTSGDNTATLVAPKEGRVITFRNLAPALFPGSGDAGGGNWRFVEESTHGASPVLNATFPHAKGEGSEKYVVQQWFGLESEVNVARHPQLLAHIGLGVANCYGVSPMADLGTPTGEPVATTYCALSNGTFTSVPWMGANLGATKLRGWCASIEAKGKSLSSIGGGKPETNHGMTGAIWVNNGRDRASLQRMLRFGPHELFVASKGELMWAVGDKVTSASVKLQADQWYHIALAVSAPVVDTATGKVSLDAKLYLSIPGQRPQDPITMQLSGLDELPNYDQIVSVGGCREGEEGEVDLTVTDLYVVGSDMAGDGHKFAFALLFYDPDQGL